MKTLFEKIGGKVAVDAAVEKFYEKVLNDDRIKHFFVDVDMEKQSSHQKKFLTYAFGGMPNYSGRSLSVSHKKMVEEMGLNDVHFDAVMENLAATLQELGVPADLMTEAAGIAETTREDILNRSGK